MQLAAVDPQQQAPSENTSGSNAGLEAGGGGSIDNKQQTAGVFRATMRRVPPHNLP